MSSVSGDLCFRPGQSCCGSLCFRVDDQGLGPNPHAKIKHPCWNPCPGLETLDPIGFRVYQQNETQTLQQTPKPKTVTVLGYI